MVTNTSHLEVVKLIRCEWAGLGRAGLQWPGDPGAAAAAWRRDGDGSPAAASFPRTVQAAEGLPVLSLLLSSRPLLPKLVLTLLSPCWVPLLRLWASWDRSMTGNRQAPRKSRAPAPRHRHHLCRRLPTGSPLGQSHPRYHRGAEGAESVLWGQNWRPALNSLWPCQLQDPEVQKHATQILRKMLQQEEAELQVWVETPVGLCRALPKKLGLGSLQGQSLGPSGPHPHPCPFDFTD